MENSRKSNSADLAHRLAGQLATLIPPHSSILIAFSGGVDSVVLLHLLHQFAPRFSWRLSALHVHHGISPHADDWATFCERRCAAYNISFHLEHVDIAPLREQGIEAAARQLRHAAYARHQRDFLALAHHADDQAETLLLQLLRGTGVRGASAMPMLTRRTTQWVRPLLACTRAEIVAYAKAHHLPWIEDESNADDRYPRNFLRHQVLPVLAQKFPAYRSTLSRSAQHFSEASTLLDELAQQDAITAIQDDRLKVAELRRLSAARAKNLTRYFLQSRGAPMPQTVQLDDMAQQLCGARDDAAVCVAYGGWQVRRYQNDVYALPALPDFDKHIQLPNQDLAPLEWSALGMQLDFVRTQGEGISLDKLRSAPVTLRVRQGGEAMRPHVHAAKRTLKNLLQEHQMPPWLRDRLPLLYCGEELVCVLGVAIAAGFQAEAGEEGMQMRLVGDVGAPDWI
jgi:tRNA(Ile)-lysidine synthase